jgi:serine/threonine protein kinase
MDQYTEAIYMSDGVTYIADRLGYIYPMTIAIDNSTFTVMMAIILVSSGVIVAGATIISFLIYIRCKARAQRIAIQNWETSIQNQYENILSNLLTEYRPTVPINIRNINQTDDIRWGGQSCVIKAFYNNQTYAFKQWKENSPDIKREVSFLSHLNHDNIVKFIGPVENDNNEVIGLLLEHVNGTSLLEYIDKVSTKNITNVLYQVADTLLYLHDKNIVHADLTPGMPHLTRN